MAGVFSQADVTALRSVRDVNLSASDRNFVVLDDSRRSQMFAERSK